VANFYGKNRKLKNHKEHRVSHELRFINEHEKNNELKRTETNSGGLSSYGIRTSSLLIFIPEKKCEALWAYILFPRRNYKVSWNQ